jgi:hypothetical protein
LGLLSLHSKEFFLPTSINNLPITYGVSDLQRTYETDTFINSIRRREDFSFSSRLDSKSVSIALVQGSVLSAANNLSINDKSNTLVGNYIESEDNTIIESVDSFIINTDRFLVTDRFDTSSNTPLYKKHLLGKDIFPRTAGTDEIDYGTFFISQIQILDKNFQPISNQIVNIPKYVGSNLYSGAIYSNLNTSYDYINQMAEVYYVSYVYTIYATPGYQHKTEILNNQPIFEVATLEDLDPITGDLDVDAKAYLLQETDTYFLVQLPITTKYAFKKLSNTQLVVNPPKSVDANDLWNVSIPNSQVFGNVNGSIEKYYLAEYSNQLWNPSIPYKKADIEIPIIVNSRTLKVEHSNIQQILTSNMPIDILINDKSDNGLISFTTDPLKEGLTSPNGLIWTLWDNIRKVGITGADSQGGFIDIEGYILDSSTQNILCSYYYQEDNYTLNAIDFNPLSNQLVLENTIVLFLMPSSQVTTQSLFYLVVNPSGRVINSNWSLFDNSTETLFSGNTLYYQEVPDWEVNPTTIFQDTYSIEGSGTFFVVGEVNISENISIKDLKLIDSRVQGGGLKPSVILDRKKKNPEISWFWDIGFKDGIYYPGTKTCLVQVPVEIMSGAGGVLTSLQIKDIISRHMSPGTYPVSKAYGKDVSITEVLSTDDEVTINWLSIPDTYYNIYYSSLSTGPWTLVNGTPQQDVGADNTITISSLTPNQLYYIMIVPGDVIESQFIPLCEQPISQQNNTAQLWPGLNNTVVIRTLRG